MILPQIFRLFLRYEEGAMNNAKRAKKMRNHDN